MQNLLIKFNYVCDPHLFAFGVVFWFLHLVFSPFAFREKSFKKKNILFSNFKIFFKNKFYKLIKTFAKISFILLSLLYTGLFRSDVFLDLFFVFFDKYLTPSPSLWLRFSSWEYSVSLSLTIFLNEKILFTSNGCREMIKFCLTPTMSGILPSNE